ncbi:hypothetical protein Q9292_00760 [Methylophilus sp. VKM B-3414]|uniref:hypothetical protein n=1 Tax=Methylophilus sp. VKM B-3414 TaxID=3076121 RepID=UPI0028C80593|nr:hypothetical protein [Methylophilus sp. VKM B-3414]MDT7848121.1 hypothetical protein [Methylophilus sp. VKM B-3414]
MSGKFGVLNPFHKWKKGDLPGDPTVSIVLNEYVTYEEGIIISATLATDSEIDYAIDGLQKSLESARKEAKRMLKAQKDKIHASFKRQD